MLKEQKIYPNIQTERLLLRMFRAEDLNALYVLFSDPDVQKYLSPENKRTREQLKNTLKNFVSRWNERDFGLWCVTKKDTEEVVGYCGFQYFDHSSNIEIAFAFLKKFWGNGYATESAMACLRFWFEELPFETLFAATCPENITAQQVLKKCDMKFVEKSDHYKMELITYSLSRGEYQRNDLPYNLFRLDLENNTE